MTQCSARPPGEADSRYGFGRTQLSFASRTFRGSGASRYIAGLRKMAPNVLERSCPATVFRTSVHRRLTPARTLSGRGRHSPLSRTHCAVCVSIAKTALQNVVVSFLSVTRSLSQHTHRIHRRGSMKTFGGDHEVRREGTW